jgi:hypothetical protein
MQCRWKGLAAVVVASSALLFAGPPADAGVGGGANVIPPQARVQGHTYGEWSRRQWAWELTAVNDVTHPVVDPNPGTAAHPEPVDCTLGQVGNVWFLAGTTYAQPFTTAYRSCTIPTGKFLFFPIVDTWSDNLNCPGLPPFDQTADEIKAVLQQQTDTIVPGSLLVTVDGKSVAGLDDASTSFRVQANGFTYTMPADNALGAVACGESFPAGTMPPSPGAFADGVYVMLPPLPVGTHHISFAGAESGGPFGAFSENVSYALTVSPH